MLLSAMTRLTADTPSAGERAANCMLSWVKKLMKKERDEYRTKNRD
jgi:hypothetical protein